MNKFFDYLDKNAIKIVLTATLILGVFLGGLYISTIKSDVARLSTKMVVLFGEQKDSQDATTVITFKGLLLIIEQLESIAQQQQYVIDQNRARDEQTIVISEKIEKPTYKSLKAHSVFIVGCAGKSLEDDKRIDFPIGEEGMCWSGTGVVIKMTITETYILTNNHVSGKGEKDVHLYIENGRGKVEATIVGQHPTVDAAVIKVPTRLINKVAIPGIATAKIQDPVYTVGNPLGVKNVYSEGVVAGYEDVSMLIQMPCIYGNSGSGVYDQRGNLVGLIYALEVYPGFLGIPEARITHSLVVDSVSIRAFLKDLNLYE
mgnify:CR=1 FL=1